MKSKDICTKIRELRKAMKLTQSQFAERTNLSEDSIGKIERGVTVPTIETVNKIAHGLRIPIESLIVPAKEKTSDKNTSALNNLTAYLAIHPPADIELIHEIAVKILEKRKETQ